MSPAAMLSLQAGWTTAPDSPLAVANGLGTNRGNADKTYRITADQASRLCSLDTLIFPAKTKFCRCPATSILTLQAHLMATYLLDFDGVFFQYGTMVPMEGAVDYVRSLKAQGHQVVFLTARQPTENDLPELSIAKTKTRLDELEVPYDTVISGMTSPRILINDEGAYAINYPKDAPWTSTFSKVAVRDPTRSTQTGSIDPSQRRHG